MAVTRSANQIAEWKKAVISELPPRERETVIEVIAVHKDHGACRWYGMGMKGKASDLLKLLNENDWTDKVREYALASAGNDPATHPKHLPPVNNAWHHWISNRLQLP